MKCCLPGPQVDTAAAGNCCGWRLLYSLILTAGAGSVVSSNCQLSGRGWLQKCHLVLFFDLRAIEEHEVLQSSAPALLRPAGLSQQQQQALLARQRSSTCSSPAQS